MPATCAVTVSGRADIGTVGEYLRGVSDGTSEPVGLAVVPVEADGQVAAGKELDAALACDVAEITAGFRLTGQAGQSAQVMARQGDAAMRIAFLGVGDRSARALRRAGGELGRMLRPGESVVTDAVAGRPDEQVRAFTEGILLGSYRFSEKSPARVTAGDPGNVAADAEGAQARPAEVRLLVPDRRGEPGRARAAADGAVVLAGAVALARDLTNTPSVRKCPQWLADAAAAEAARAGLTVRVRDEAELAAAGFGGILAVGSGSDRPPRLIELRYEPESPGRHVVIVGKGITFDSGGLSLKPNDGMKAMKTDMAGAAVVIATMSALARLGVKDRVTGLVAAAENMPSGSAYRPGDVVTHFGGRTVEVLNTDAEGRLVLADALAYADAELAPDAILDVATLTGAARMALGTSYAALYSCDDGLAAALLAAGEASGDRLWRMPLADEYADALDSPVADLANVSRHVGQPGSVTAALFLREFAGNRAWAHLDIAGAARAGSDDGDLTAGATGFGTRLLLRWLCGN